MIKRLPSLSIPVLLFMVVILLMPGCTCGQGAQQAPSGPPRVTSFKVANENVAPGNFPLFTWEAANASAVTITQDGEVVYHIEAVPDSGGALLTPLHGKAYATTSSENEMRQPYSPGIYPVGFKGASNGKPSKITWKFGDKDPKPGSAEITVLSPEGKSTAKVAFNFVADTGQGSPPPLITPPPCVKSASSERISPSSSINRWAQINLNNMIEDDMAPQFEFKVTNPRIISIRQGNEFISSVEIINPPATSGISLPSLTGEAHAATTSENEVKQPYSPGVYPVIYQGSSSGRPATIAWKFGEKSGEDSAEITVCSRNGDVAMARLNFIIKKPGNWDPMPWSRLCPTGCACLTANDAEKLCLSDKDRCVDYVCGFASDNITKKYCYKIPPPSRCSCGCPCVSDKIAEPGGLTKDELCAERECNDKGDELKHCYRCPKGCDCLPPIMATELGYKQKCIEWKCSEDGQPDRYCYRKPKQAPIINFSVSRNIVAAMDTVNFIWNVTGDNVTAWLVSDGSQKVVPLAGSEEFIIMKTTCYYLTAENPWGRASEKQCITVQSSGVTPPPVIITPLTPPPPRPPVADW